MNRKDPKVQAIREYLESKNYRNPVVFKELLFKDYIVVSVNGQLFDFPYFTMSAPEIIQELESKLAG